MSDSKVYKWSFIDRVMIAVLNFGGNIALARMLTEADFGLLAMIAIFVSIAYDLSSCGLSDGLIHKVSPTADDYSTVFVANTSMGLLFGSMFFFGAPLMAGFFGHQELVGIMRVLGVCFLFQCMSYVQETYMRKQLRMKEICFVRVGATASALALGITLAALGFGYWALVCTQILLSVFFFIYYVIASRWFPKIRFNTRSFKELFNYGVHLMLAYLGTIIGKNINTSVLGRAYSSAMSGIYYQGAKLANVPFGVSETSLNSPFFVVASNEPDPVRRRRLIIDMLPMIIGINGLLLSLMLVISAPSIELLYGQKWLAAIPVFRILALFEFMVCIKYFCQTICKVYGRTTVVRNLAVMEIAVQLGLLAIFFNRGILWIAWTQAAGAIVTVGLYLIVSARLTCMNAAMMARAFASALWLPALAGIMAAGVYAAALTQWPTMPPVAACSIVAGTYAAVMLGVGETARPRIYTAWRSRIIKK